MHILPLLIVPLFLILFWTARQLGLHAEVPRTPELRVHHWASQTLGELKRLLSGATSLQLRDNRLTFLSQNREMQVWIDEGKLWSQSACEPARQLSQLGPQGSVAFSLQGSSLQCAIKACEGEVSRSLLATLPIQSDQPT